MSATQGDWLRKSEAAKRMGCSERHIERLVAAGKLPAYKDGPQIIRFRAEEIDAYLMARRAQPRRHQDEPKPVRMALHKVDRAREALELIREAVRGGDTSVTAAELAEAEAAVQLAELQADAARRQLADEAGAVRQQRLEQHERERRKRKAIDDQVKRESFERAIESGAAWERLQDLLNSGTPMSAIPWADEVLERTPSGLRSSVISGR